MLVKTCIKLGLLLTLFSSVSAWDDDDLEVFDVVEEVNQNFYELMGVAPDAAPSEIKSAFKKLTLKLHPDKNDSPDADVQFRNLVSVHNILKDPGKREKKPRMDDKIYKKLNSTNLLTDMASISTPFYARYHPSSQHAVTYHDTWMTDDTDEDIKYNEVLKNGLPNWRSAVYYYRHVRKMGLAEGALILFIIITFGQYAVGWAAYAEKRYTAEQILSTRITKKQKKSGFDTGLAEILDQLPKPSVKDTLPFQIPRAIWWSITAIPYAIIDFKKRLKEQKEEAIRQKKREEEDRLRAEREAAAAEAARAARAAAGPRKRRGFVLQERECLLDPADEPEGQARTVNLTPSPVVISGGLWTDEDLEELVRLVKKYPGGHPERWQRIADAMCRPVPEVTHMAAKMKENCYKVPASDASEAPAPPEPPKKVKTRKAEELAGAGSSPANWSQGQQKALEAALAKYPKGGAGDRWEKIANSVQGKTKEECMQRCKYLSDLVKKQKQQEEEELQNSNAETVNNTDSQPDNEGS